MVKTISAVNPRPDAGRRRALRALGGLALAACAVPWKARAQAAPKIRIGYWPIAAGLPFYAALEKGFFKEAGVDVEGIKFAGPPQIVEGMIAGRVDGTANGTASAALAIGELASPGLLKIIVSNPSNVQNVLDEFIVADKSAFKTISDLKGGKRVSSGPGIQNVTLAKAVLEKAGVTDATVIELPIGQHVAAIAAGQIDAAYTLEPTGTVGRLQGSTRILEAGVIAKYILGDPRAPWFGGSASLASAFIAKYPEATAKYIAAYLRGVEFIRKSPAEARAFLKGYTAIEGSLTAEVPLAAYTTYKEFTASDIAYFQKFFDLFSDRKIFSARVPVGPLIYKA
ncbi:MAG TPA: ABC transporter substrate-binding protein [Burkholderiales bacterium]|nr:ABC transporter substrate-binding protein [Burkholderiales bacterium]